MKESRVKKSLLNARMNTICYFASLVVAFFTRKVLLDNLGTEFIGLTGTLGSLLSFLNVAELGIGTAIGYVLYKPLFEDNKSKINEIISVLGYLYHCVGLFIIGAGLLLSMILPWIITNTTISLGVVYFGFYAYLGSTVLAYFVNYRMVLLSADQRNYIITGYFQLTTSVKVILQMILAIYVCSFYLYLVIEFVLSIINALILQRKIKMIYPWLHTNIKQGRLIIKNYPEIVTYIKQVFVHKIAGFAQYQLMPFLIYAYASLSMVAIYGNYTIVIQRVQSLINGIMGSTGAGIGNLISEGNKEKTFSVYKELLTFRIFIATFISGSLYMLITPFIHVWLGKEYELSPSIVNLIILQTFLVIVRDINDQFINGFGLFYDIWAPIVESVILLFSSLLLGGFYGIKGVLWGPIISVICIVYIWKPYFLFSKGFNYSVFRFIKIFVTNIIISTISFWGTICICHVILKLNLLLNDNWLIWIKLAILYCTILGLIEFVMFFTLSLEFRHFINRISPIHKSLK